MNEKMILFIDEQPTEIEAACDFLTARYGEGSWFYAQSSKIGLEFLKNNSNKVSCISLDLLMPFVSMSQEEDRTKYTLEGLYVLKLINDAFPNIPVVCYSFVKEEFATDFISKHKALYIYKGDSNSYSDLLRFFNKHLLTK